MPAQTPATSLLERRCSPWDEQCTDHHNIAVAPVSDVPSSLERALPSAPARNAAIADSQTHGSYDRNGSGMAWWAAWIAWRVPQWQSCPRPGDCHTDPVWIELLGPPGLLIGNRPIEPGVVEVGSQQGCAFQMRTLEPGTNQLGSFQVGPGEVGLPKIGIGEIGPVQSREAHPRPAQMRALQVGTRELCLPQVGTAQIRVHQPKTFSDPGLQFPFR